MLLLAEHRDPVSTIGQHVTDALVAAQERALLVNDDAVQRLGELDAACVGRNFACQQFEQRRFAGAVRSDNANAVAALDAQGEVLEERPVPISLRDALGRDDRFGTDVVAFDGHFGDTGRAHHGRPRGAHLVQLLKAALIALASGGDTALEPVELNLQLGIHLMGGAFFLGEDFLLPGFKSAKADFGAPDLAPVNPERFAGQAG